MKPIAARMTLPGLFIGLALTVSNAFAQKAPSLYEGMGGYDVIAAFTDDFFARFDADPELRPFLGGINEANAARVRQHVVDFLCARTGGPCLYTGRDMTATHAGLGITDEHFDRVISHMRDALDAQAVADDVAEEVLAIMEAQRDQVVQERSGGGT